LTLRDGVIKVKEPKAQALMEASAAAPDCLIKAFDDYEKGTEA
jgi:hypothetical protein